MSRPHVPEALRRLVEEQAGRRCGYCLTHEEIAGYAMDRIIALTTSTGRATLATLHLNRPNLVKARRI